jgi:hypothetical protein
MSFDCRFHVILFAFTTTVHSEVNRKCFIVENVIKFGILSSMLLFTDHVSECELEQN